MHRIRIAPDRTRRIGAIAGAGMIALASTTASPVRADVPVHTGFELEARTNLLVNDNGYNLPPGSSFNSITPDIDASANVAFAVQVVPGGATTRPGLWTGAHGIGGIAWTGPVDSLIGSSVSTNDSGNVVFTIFDTPSSDGIYRYDATLGTAQRIGTSPLFPNSYGSPAIDNAGDIGFQANFAMGRAYASLSGATATIHVADAGLSPGSPYTYLYTPAFNDQRRIAGKVATSSDLTSNTEIRSFASDGGSIRLAANRGTDALSPIKQFDNSVAYNDLGHVAFVATRFADNRRVVYRTDGATLTMIAEVDPSGTIRDIEFFPPALNDAGNVAFRAKDANGQAIYVGDGTTLRRVVGKGDLLPSDLGRAQIGQNNDTDAVFGGAPVMNDSGDIAFVAALHPPAQPQVEWGSGVYVAYARDAIFGDGFD